MIDAFAGGGNERRTLPRGWWKAIFVLCAMLSVLHIYFALVADLSELMRNAIHFGGFAFLCALTYPAFQATRFSGGVTWRYIDLAFGAAVAAAAIYLAFAEDAIYARGVRLSPLDWLAGIVVILGAIELTRRATGFVIPVLIVLALSYIAFWGQYVPGVFRFAGLSLETVMFRSIYGDDAIFGTIARISSTYVFLFIIFGAFLLRSGAGDFVIDMSRAVAGKMVGGPGLVAVMASGLTGTISGSAVANTASTGVITIPMMKRAGFPPKFAAAVEASASTGGQLMPPIMGAGAFVMAAYTQIPYETIVAAATLPAILYFASVAMFVRIEAKKQNLMPFTEEGVTIGEAIRNGGASFIIPIGLLIGLLVSGFTPTYAAAIGIAAVVASSWLTRNPMGPKAVFEALALGARNMVMTGVLLCSVGLVVNVIATAGVGNVFSLMIADWSDGNVLIAITLIALASFVLGMGLPVTAAYIVLATLSAPALAGMIGDGQLAQLAAAGSLPAEAAAVVMLAAPEAVNALTGPMPLGEAQALISSFAPEIRSTLRDMSLDTEATTFALLSAHMIIFWLSQDSNVTPPVCLAAFTAAAIAKSSPMATGLASWKVAKGIYIIPLLFAYTPLLSGNWGAALGIFFLGLIAVYGLAAALEGWMEARLPLLLRLLSGVGGIACLWPGMLWLNGLGAIAIITIFFTTFRAGKHPPAEAVVQA